MGSFLYELLWETVFTSEVHSLKEELYRYLRG
ncbi:hypothetical protein B23_0597 [Geobacillus thermoleovorans B23]|nr:hypothetical protein B23_0597 [Geobacillus thermoleovorans B23]